MVFELRRSCWAWKRILAFPGAGRGHWNGIHEISQLHDSGSYAVACM